jgi:hypothetical protein
MPVILDFEHKCNICKIIDNSPYQDMNGVKFIPFTSTFLACFFKSIFVNNKNDLISYYRLREYYNAIIGGDDFATYDWGKSDYRNTFSMGSSKMVFVTRNEAAELDEKSAWESVNEYVKNNYLVKDKYVLPFYLTLGSSSCVDGILYVKIYDFLNDKYSLKDFENHPTLGVIKTAKEKRTLKLKKYDSQESMFKEYDRIKAKRLAEESKDSAKELQFEFEEPVDKMPELSDNMTLKQVNNLCEFIDRALEFLYSQGIDLSKKLKHNVRTSLVDDNCGYSIALNDDDFAPSVPFPEVIEGNEELANM